MRGTLGVVVLFGIAITAQTAPDQPSFVNEGVVNAPVARVWQVWSTSEGYKATGVAKAEIDLRIGGLIRSVYSPSGLLGDDATIENEILAYEPQRMIAFRIHRPPKSFPFKEAWRRTWFVITLTDVGNNRTLVHAASMGFGSDEESMAMRKFFEAGNATTLKSIQNYFDKESK